MGGALYRTIVLIGIVIAIGFLVIRTNNQKNDVDVLRKKISDLEGREGRLNTIRNSILSNEVLLYTIDANLSTALFERNISYQPIDISELHLRVLPFKNPSPRIKKWASIKIGWNMPLVKKILGDPEEIIIPKEGERNELVANCYPLNSGDEFRGYYS